VFLVSDENILHQKLRGNEHATTIGNNSSRRNGFGNVDIITSRPAGMFDPRHHTHSFCSLIIILT